MLKELIRALVEIAKAIRGENGNNNKKNYFELEDAPKWVTIDFENFIPIDEFVQQLKEQQFNGDTFGKDYTEYFCVYDKIPEKFNYCSIAVERDMYMPTVFRYDGGYREIVPGKYVINRGG